MRGKLPLIIFGLIAVTAIAGTLYAATLNGNTNQSTDDSQQQNTAPAESSTPATSESTGKTITSAEVAKHASASDCWLIIQGKVYDVTKYIPTHPGGGAITSGCGKDATAMFNQRPQDGESHSSGARSQLQNYYIGDLAQ